ncbi:MAG: glycoside hydrolase family 2 [Lachnospiraceae bacterium]|nr:glycoside hydrolase family 2 [Lachnospiraceae bacterium]
MAWTKYPRPQFKRELWQSLNGKWSVDGKSVTVPFPPESLLSGLQETMPEKYTYERTFSLSENMRRENGRILLHFGAADQIAKVYLNGEKLGSHIGGYLPFTFDITKQLHRSGENLLAVKITDTLSTIYPYGKQCKKRGGMWYTPISGLWQSVWLEWVPDCHIQSIKITPSMTGVQLSFICSDETTIPAVSVPLENGATLTATGKDITLDLSGHNPHLWSPEDPYLYPLHITCGEDKAEAYFALREISWQERGGKRVPCLNNEPIFLQGVLDQGYFMDGIYTPHEEEEYERDILRMKELGMNMLRKHIKIEPDIFYYYCDKLGMLVFQDLVNSGDYSYLRDTVLPAIGFTAWNDTRSKAPSAQKEFFLEAMEDTFAHLHNHPCIIGYTLFNEGWGQFNSDAVYHKAKELDPTRLYDSTSGWFAQKENDFDSRHIYFNFQHVPKKPRGPLFMSEFGGCSFIVEGHTFQSGKNYGYGKMNTQEELHKAIRAAYDRVIFAAIPKGCVGYVYTQLSDVEDETNGFYTYDRQICKVSKEWMHALCEEVTKTFLENL